MIIKIDALDTLFFRDGRPFSRGYETWASGIFPPAPSVFYGALRSAWFAEYPNELSKAGTPDDPTRELKLQSLRLQEDSNEYLPVPLDLVGYKNPAKGEKDKCVLLEMTAMASIKSSLPTPFALTAPDDQTVEPLTACIIPTGDLRDYLTVLKDNFYCTRVQDYAHFVNEAKIGIGLNKKCGTVEESQLYRVNMVRPYGLSFLLEYDGLNLPENGMLKLGGEGKAVSYTKVDSLEDIIYPEISKRFKLVLTTPAVFEKGWLPSWIDEETLQGELAGVKVKLLTAAIGKPQFIGGWDIKNKRPKPMRKAVPAGSVYYLEILDNGSDFSKLQEIHGKAISDNLDNIDYQLQGFGIAYIGRLE